MDFSSDVMAYSTTAYDYIFNVASKTTIYRLYSQTTYDMANDSTTSDFNSSTRLHD